ncbi:MAG TPA: hypothetical protein VL175_20560 [Pirellulales bacterium]|nr:hypothetical protein [Pirellulales bacterium]
MKKLLVVLGAALLLIYLLASRSLWLADLERRVLIGTHRLSKEIDVSQPRATEWKISADDWPYEGEVRVSLILDDLSTIPRDSYEKKSMKLQIKMDAYAITFEPTGKGTRVEGLRADRLIRNWYYRTDIPLSPEARIWEGVGGSRHEFGLAGVQRYPWEDTYIVVQIIQGDPVLAAAKPRLEVSGAYDYAVFSHIWPLRIIRDGTLLVLALCVLGLAYVGLKNS